MPSFESYLKNPWVWGGVAALAIGYYVFFSGSSDQTSTDTTGDVGSLGSIALQPPIASGGGSSILPDTSSSSLDALTSAITALNAGSTTPESVQLAQINASQLATEGSQGTTVFQSLLSTLKAHAGLGAVSATVPGLGTVSTWFGKPTKVITKTAPATLSFQKGNTKATANAGNTAKINTLIKQGFKAV